MFFLGGPRIAYRLFRQSRTQQQVKGPDAVPTLIVGRAADAEVLLRAIESGAVKNVLPVGILSPSSADQDQELRGVPVRGFLTDLEDDRRRVARARRPRRTSGLDAERARAGDCIPKRC